MVASARLVTPFLLLLCAPVACRRTEPPADLVIRNTTIFTAEPGDSGGTMEGSVAVRGGVIIYVGPDSGVTPLLGRQTREIDGAGRLLLPGFVDAHVHPYSGVELAGCDLSRDSTPEGILATIGRCARADTLSPWVRGTGWALPTFPGANPTAAALDTIISDRPAFFSAADGHSAWVNSRALEMAGVTAATRDPPNGVIERNARGQPTGTLRESAMALVERLLPAYTSADYAAGFARAFDMALGYGITAIIDANADSVMLEAYRSMDSAGTLPLRVTAAQKFDPAGGDAEIARVIRFRDRYSRGKVNAGSAKIFLDGVIEARTAAMLEPYLDRPGFRGEPTVSQEVLARAIRSLDSAGIQVHVHAIGDRAIRMALDAFETVQRENPGRDRRHMIAHLELIDPADVPRFAGLGVFANFQPFWASADPYITELTIPALGPERSRWLYPIQSVLAAGGTVVAGSDWSVSTMNPLEAIEVAATRRGTDEPPGEAWIPEEVVTPADLLLAYTWHGARARFAEATTGSIRAGKRADLVLLDRNILAGPRERIGEAGVVMVVVDSLIANR